ncbi:MAG: TonB family protein [Acidobacteriota bacterium]|nr:TonB family protein [Acidobacteriota bacterium]
MTKQTILLIENDPSAIEGTLEAFSDSGLNVQIAMDGESGLDAFRELHPDLVIVETMVPKRSGFDVCRAIKAETSGAGTPVIVTAATYRGDQFRTKALTEFGADEYFEKPVDPAALVETCRRLIPDPGSTTASQVTKAAPKKKTHKSLALDHLSEDEIMNQLDNMIDSIVGDETDAEAEPEAEDTPQATQESHELPATPAVTPPPAPAVSKDAEREIDSALHALIPTDAARSVAPPVPETSPTAFEDAVKDLELEAVRDRSESTPSPTPPSPPNRIGLWVGIVVVLAMIAGGGYVFLSPNSTPEPPSREPFQAEPVPLLAAKAEPLSEDKVAEPIVEKPVQQDPAPVDPAPVDVAPVDVAPVKVTPAPRKTPVRKFVRKTPVAVETPKYLAEPIANPSVSNAQLQDLTAEALDAELEAIELTPEAPRTIRGALVEMGLVDVKPTLVHRVSPTYPPLARRMRQEGVVTLTVLVKEDGTVGDILNPAGTKGSMLDKAAIDAVRGWKYEPATKNGVEVQTWLQVRIKFAL